MDLRSKLQQLMRAQQRPEESEDELTGRVERLIREAQDKGQFSNLKGEGKPQKLEDNPFEDPEMRLAHKILANAGFSPPWLELLKEIDGDIRDVDSSWKDYESFRRRQMLEVSRHTVLRFSETVREIDATRNRTLERLRKRWEDINKRIEYLNSIVPSESFTRVPIHIGKKTAQFERQFPLISDTLMADK